jgi:DNA-directed RNA polymerase specialized sigma24 family protein
MNGDPLDEAVRAKPRERATIEHLSLLLTKLDPHDAPAAARAYEELRRRLILYFRLRRPHEAEDLADSVLDRVARRLADGVVIETVESYAVGAARFVLQERYAATQREQRVHQQIGYTYQVEGYPSGILAAIEAGPDVRLAALKNCLSGLESAERGMILEYYGADGSQRMRTRQSLAQKLSLSLNALHNRALRLRKQLERCVESHSQGGEAT